MKKQRDKLIQILSNWNWEWTNVVNIYKKSVLGFVVLGVVCLLCGRARPFLFKRGGRAGPARQKSVFGEMFTKNQVFPLWKKRCMRSVYKYILNVLTSKLKWVIFLSTRRQRRPRRAEASPPFGTRVARRAPFQRPPLVKTHWWCGGCCLGLHSTRWKLSSPRRSSRGCNFNTLIIIFTCDHFINIYSNYHNRFVEKIAPVKFFVFCIHNH